MAAAASHFRPEETMDPNLVPAVSAIFMGLFAWLSRRDSLRNETRTLQLENQTVLLKGQNTQQAEQIKKLEHLTEQCHLEHKQKDALIERERERNHRLELSVAKLQAALGVADDGTKSNQPLKEEQK